VFEALQTHEYLEVYPNLRGFSGFLVDKMLPSIARFVERIQA